MGGIAGRKAVALMSAQPLGIQLSGEATVCVTCSCAKAAGQFAAACRLTARRQPIIAVAISRNGNTSQGRYPDNAPCSLPSPRAAGAELPVPRAIMPHRDDKVRRGQAASRQPPAATFMLKDFRSMKEFHLIR